MKTTSVTTPSTLPSRPLRLLRERGISDETVAHFSIQSNGTGWVYPVPNGGSALRFKNYDSKALPKYKWLPGRPESVTYYHAPDLQQAITAAGGTAWIASGEPDVWAMHSAGICNVLCWLNGEASVPASLAEDLRAWGVVEVHMAPDCDTTGRTSAAKVRDILRDSGIRFIPHALPASLGEKADIGKAWQQHREETPFEVWLHRLPVLPLPESSQPALRLNPENLYAASEDTWSARMRPEFFDILADGLGIKQRKAKDFSNLVPCLFHDDSKPSAQWSFLSHRLKCHTCGEWFSAIQVAEKLGINWRDYFTPPTTVRKPTPPARPAVVQPSAPPRSSEAAVAPAQHLTAALDSAGDVPTADTSPQEEPSLDDLGLPLEIRTALTSRGFTGVARVLDCLFYAGVQSGEMLTAKEAVELCEPANVGKNTVRDALKAGLTRSSEKVSPDAGTEPHQLDGEASLSQDADSAPEAPEPLAYSQDMEEEGESLAPAAIDQSTNFSPFFTPIKQEKGSGGANPGKNRRGRPVTYYCVPTIDELCALLGLGCRQLTWSAESLRPQDLASSKAYRIAVHRAATMARPGPAKRKEQADRLGVAITTVRTYDRPADLIVTERTKRTRLSPSAIKDYTDDRKDRPSNEWLEDAHGRQYPPTRQAFQRALQSGAVYKVWRRANDYQAGPRESEPAGDEPQELDARGLHADSIVLQDRLKELMAWKQRYASGEQVVPF